MYSDGIELSGIMENMESVLQRLRRELERGRGSIGDSGESGMTTVMKIVWEMATAWPKSEGSRERRK